MANAFDQFDQGNAFDQFDEPKAAPEGFGSRAKQDIQKRVGLASEIQRKQQRGEQGTASSVLQTVGNVGAGAVNDVLAEAISSAIPESVKQGIKSDGQAVADTDIVKGIMDKVGPHIQNAVKGWEFLKQEHPELADNLSAAANLATAYPIAGGAARASEGIAGASKATIGKLSTVLEDAAVKQATKEKEAFVKDLVMPKADESALPRMSEPGVLSGKNVDPNTYQQKVIDVIKNIPEVKPGSYVGNWKAVNNALSEEADNLVKELKKNPTHIPKDEIDAALESARKRALDTPLLASDTTIANTTDNMIKNAQRIISDNPLTSEGLLQSRKQFDRYIESVRPKIFSQNFENAASTAQREVRQTLNNLVAEKNPNAMVKESLAKQTAMYNALDTIAPKALNEPASLAADLFQSVNKLLPEGRKMSPNVAKAIGITALATAGALSPAIVAAGAAGLGVYSGGKFLLSPAAKQGLSALLKKTDEAIQFASRPQGKAASVLAPDTVTPRVEAEGESISASAPGTEGVKIPPAGIEKIPYSKTDIVDVGQPKVARIPGIEIPSAGAPSSPAMPPVDPKAELEHLYELRQQLLDAIGEAQKELDYKSPMMESDQKALKLKQLQDKFPKKGRN